MVFSSSNPANIPPRHEKFRRRLLHRIFSRTTKLASSYSCPVSIIYPFYSFWVFLARMVYFSCCRIGIGNYAYGYIRLVCVFCVDVDCYFEFCTDSKFEVRGFCSSACCQFYCVHSIDYVAYSEVCKNLCLDSYWILWV